MSIDFTLPAIVGTPLTATASGGPAGFEYQFWRLDGSTWSLVQGYGPLPAYSWTPGPGDAGEHAIQVWARPVGSSAAYEAWAGTGMFVVSPPAAAPLQVTGLLVSAPLPLRASTAATWSATVNGESGVTEYQFWRLDADQWHLVRPYTSDPNYVWVPAAADAGLHAIQVWARTAGSGAAYESWVGTGSFEVLRPAAVESVTLTAESQTMVSTGKTLQWLADGGGAPGVEYQFWRFSGSRWRIVQDYGPQAAYAWRPEPWDVGDHAVQVWARRVGSAAPYEAWAGTGTFEVVSPNGCGPMLRLEDACYSPVRSYRERDYISDLRAGRVEPIETSRAALTEWLWQSRALPVSGALPAAAVERGIRHAGIDALKLPNLQRVDRLRIDVPIPPRAGESNAPIRSLVYLLQPKVSNDRLLVLHQGHVPQAADAFRPETMLGEDVVMRMFLGKGYTVLYVQMPLIGDNTDARFPLSDISNPHELLGARREDGFNPLIAFVEPVRAAIGHARAMTMVEDVTMLGVSGGGWATTLYAAVDPGVTTSMPVAGSLPAEMNQGADDPCPHDLDWEQQQFPAAAASGDAGQPLGYLDLYVLGSTPAPGGPPRHQVQILNKYDSCCFKGAKAEGTYAEALGAFVAQAGGEYHMAIDATHAGHLISECALRAFVLPALDR